MVSSRNKNFLNKKKGTDRPLWKSIGIIALPPIFLEEIFPVSADHYEEIIKNVSFVREISRKKILSH